MPETSIPTIKDDPCERAKQLSAVRDKLITGVSVVEFRSDQGNGVSRQMRYGTADIERLEREIAAAETACAAVTPVAGGNRPRRFAISVRRMRF